jgi:plastocyanin
MTKEEVNMRVIQSQRLLKSLLIGALALAVLFGLAGSRSTVHAATQATYTVIAGIDTPYGVSAVAFGPQTLKVHRGDTVTWRFLGFHNVHFDQKSADLIVMSQIDGKTLPEMNPVIAFPSMKSGDAYKAGAGSGAVALAPSAPGAPPPTFSAVMDVEPGTYTYICDFHPGMVGTIVVVDDKTEIASPAEVEKMGKAELMATIAAGDQAYLDLLRKYPPQPQGDTLQVSAGGQDGLATIIHFFPDTATIQAGQSVTWTVPRGFEIHTVNIPLPKTGRPSEFEFVTDANKRPHVVPTDVLAGNVKSGAEVSLDANVKSGILLPGQSFTLKFTKPGVYAYFCGIHPNQFGTIVVMPPAQN